MPSQIAHILHGIAAASSLPAGWFDQFSPGAFQLGCQGPDVFYHARRSKPGGFLYGTRLHRRGWGEFLSRFRREARVRGWGPDHPGLAFLAGQATHGFLDRTAHPFVVSFAGWRIPGRPETDGLRHAHVFLERILDVKLWEVRRSTPLAECLWQDQVPSPDDFPQDFWAAWAEALHEVFPQLSARADVETRLRHAVTDTRGFLHATSPARPEQAVGAVRHGALHFYHPVALPEWDFLNAAHDPWPDPVTGRPRTESFLDLFDLAVTQAQEALGTLDDPSVDWQTLLGDGSLNLPGAEGENSAPQFSRPWDYEELLDREVKARLGALP